MNLFRNKLPEILTYIVIIFYLLYSGEIYKYFVPIGTLLEFGLFRDWKVVINDIYCTQIIQSGCRPFPYGPALLYFPFIEFFREFYYQIFPNLMVILFVLTIFIIFNKFHKQKKFLIFCIIFSPTSLLAIERGNFDLLLFLLAILICYNRFLYLNLFLISFSFLIKFYPITYFFNIFTHKKKDFILGVRYTAILTLIISFIFLYFHKDIFLGAFETSSNSKSGFHMLFSIKSTAKLIKYFFSTNYILLLFITYLAFIGIIYVFVKYLKKNNIYEKLTLHDIEDKLFLIGTNTALFSYLVFSNYYYREIFLILSIPLVIKVQSLFKNNLFRYFLYFIIFRYLFLHVYNFFILGETYNNINGIRVFNDSFLIVFTLKSILDFIFKCFLSSIVFFQNYQILKACFKRNE